ncbi:ApeI family dehydratase [Zooshikella harenae]|uniref:ApeI dehydratase-like domain-containing protein n=1 Tax=Zooshikella harenae TaxID=2827238 RepID=A0ABS5ZB24_9GAMM|nr:hypothetical protein [Zooshikella harenae]MBU2711257.1 hypothetical protein [Zooshikella harenae]
MSDQPLLPDVIEVVSNQDIDLISIDIKINIKSDSVYFIGHFPDMPILPGVVQVHWVMLFAQKYLLRTFKVHRIETIKFQRIIKPNTKLTLKLVDNKCGKLSFTYSAGDVIYGSGRIIYDESL